MELMRTYVNLLPLKHRQAGLLRALLPRWCVAWAVGTAVFAGVVWMTRSHHKEILAAVADREAACRPIMATAAANTRMHQEIRRFDRRETLVGQLHDDKPVLCLLAAVSRGAELCGGRIVVRDFQFQQQAAGPAASRPLAGPQQAAPNAQSVLTLEGDALDNLAIAHFATALKDSALFRDVVLQTSLDKSSPDAVIHSFIVRCEL